MNFKTTIILFVLLLIVGGIVLFTQNAPEKKPQDTEQVAGGATGVKILDLDASQIAGLTIVAADGTRTTLVKQGDTWKMTEPAVARAVKFQTDDLIHTITELRSQGQPASGSATDAGLDKPRYKIQLTTSDGKSKDLCVGNDNAIGDATYFQVAGGDIHLIDASLPKTLKTAPQDLRDKRLFENTLTDAKQCRLTYDQQNILLQRDGSNWKIVEPEPLLGDAAAITSLVSTATSLEASEFVSNDSDELGFARFDHPILQIQVSPDAPATQPSADSRPSGIWETLTVGAPDSLAKDHYFVKMSGGVIAKIAATSLDSLKKKPLDLRNKDVVKVLPADITNIAIQKDTFLPSNAATTQATQPTSTTRPTSSQLIVLQRRPKPAPVPIGPMPPATQPSTTGPSTTASTKPAILPPQPQSVWKFNVPAEPSAQVDDAKVEALLAKFNPLHAERYLEAPPSAPLLQHYLLTLNMGSLPDGSPAKSIRIQIIRPTQGQAPWAIYNGLIFELPTTLLDSIDADFHKPKAP